jgi:hypothetical protein
MKLPDLFNDLILKQLNVHAAWLPITNTFSIGDYGLISNGVFSRLGNIEQDFGVSFTTKPGNPSTIDFKSAGTRVFKLSAGAKVNTIPAGAVDAKVLIQFGKEQSFWIQSPEIQVTEIVAIQKLAEQLSKIKAWRNKFKCIFQVYHAKNAVIFSTVEANSEIEFSGDISALDRLDLAHAGINFSSKKSLGLEIKGKEGTIGLGLFRVTSPLIGKPTADTSRSATKTSAKTGKPMVEIVAKKMKDDL